MAKAKTGSAIWEELFHIGLYKPNQGRLTRQLTGLALSVIVLLGTYTASQGPLASQPTAIRVGLPWAVTAVALWLIYRFLNYPPFADFLVSVEGEMDKVSWASKTELYRATIVVICMMFFLGLILWGYDLAWNILLHWLGILRI